MRAACAGSALLAGLALAAGCLPQLPSPPGLLDPEVRCDDSGRWAFEIVVQHDEPVVGAGVDAWLVLPTEQDGLLLATIGLSADGARWWEVTEPGGPLRCGEPLDYAFVFFAEDEGGDVGLRQVAIDGERARVDRRP